MMIPYRPFYIISLGIMLFTKVIVVVYMLSAGDYDFLSWKNSQKYLQTHRVSPALFLRFRIPCSVFRGEARW